MPGERHQLSDLLSYGRTYYEKEIDASFPDISLVFKKKTQVFVYGAARLGRIFKKHLADMGVHIAGFVDGNQALWGSNIDDVKVMSPTELRENYFNSPILVASLLYETEICDSLGELGFPLVYPLSYLNYKLPEVFVSSVYAGIFSSLFIKKHQTDILQLDGLWADELSRKVFHNIISFRLKLDKGFIKGARSPGPLYFEQDIICLSKNEVFLDCGAYTGDSVDEFFNATGGLFKKVYCFEPDRSNFLKLREVAEEIGPSRVTPVNSGVYETVGEISFNEAGTLDTQIGNGPGSVTLPVISIDSFIENREPATFIKMDIEGAERKALSGARETIGENKPKLAISVYHKATDLWQIPLFIKTLNPLYQLYLRHYTNEVVDTVCYAI